VFVLKLLDKEELWMEREQKAREGVNSQTRERMRIPAQKVPAFSAGQGLKQAI
jgi:nucleoid DNA-binding protein